MARIREFCLSDMPIIMFDKNEDYVVLTVNEVCLPSPPFLHCIVLTLDF